MFLPIFLFEVKQYIKNPFTWIFWILMLAEGVFDLINTGGYFATDKTYINAPVIIYSTMAGMGYVAFVVCAIAGASTLGKDSTHQTAPIIYTMPVKESAFFWARYAGNFCMLCIIFSAYPVGIALANYSGYISAASLGPFSWVSLFKGWVTVFLVNLFFLYTCCFSLAVFTKKNAGSYAAMLFFIMLTIFGDIAGGSKPLLQLSDPTAFAVMHHTLEHLSAAEKNNFMLPLSGLFLYSRLIWFAFGLLLLIATHSFFNFKRFARQKIKKKSIIAEEEINVTRIPFFKKINQPHLRFTTLSFIKKAITAGWLEFKKVVRPVAFILFLGALLLLYLAYILLGSQGFYSASPALPITLEITDNTRPLTFFIFLFLIVFTVELLFEKQISGFWTIADALPLPNWVTVLSKIIGMIYVSLLLTICFTFFGVIVQVAKGYYHFEWNVYINHLIGRWLPKYAVYILLTAFIAGVTANRYATHCITIIFLFFSVVLHETNAIEQNRFNFMFSPGSDFNTDMNGYGIFTAANAWYMLYWFCFSVSLLMIALWLWQYGTPVSFWNRLLNVPKRLSAASASIFIIAVVGFIACSNTIYQTVNVENDFKTEAQERAEKVRYEKKYKRYEIYPHPKISHLNLSLAIFPDKRRADYTAGLTMLNQSNCSVDTLHIEWMAFSKITSLAVKGYSLTCISKDDELHHSIYKLNHPIQPGDSIFVTVSGTLQYSGFTNNDPQKELTFNGSFLSDDIVPFFGYDRRRELQENRYRAENNLPRVSNRLPPITDSVAGNNCFASPQADKFSFTMQISTAANQIIVAPGELKKQWTTGNRSFYVYTSEQKEVFNFHILSATYKVKKENTVINGNPVTIEVYYHPHHYYNVSYFIIAAKQALENLTPVLGKYPYKTLRIAERPRYDNELFAYENVIALPENHGWINDIHAMKDMDYITYAIAKLAAKQYMQQSNISATQGYPVMTDAVPDYFALSVFKKYYDDAAFARLLDKKKDIYSRGQGSEKNDEPALLQCDDKATYVSEEKGGYVLYAINNRIHNGTMDSVISNYLKTAKSSYHLNNINSFYDSLLAKTPEKQLQFVKTAFEKNSYNLNFLSNEKEKK